MDLLELQEQAIVQEMPEIQVGVSTFVETMALPFSQGRVQLDTDEQFEARFRALRRAQQRTVFSFAGFRGLGWGWVFALATPLKKGAAASRTSELAGHPPTKFMWSRSGRRRSSTSSTTGAGGGARGVLSGGAADGFVRLTARGWAR